MFYFDSEIIDMVSLNENFSLSTLWQLREDLNNKVYELENQREVLINLLNKSELKLLQKKLYYLGNNISLIEEVMLSKEDAIFEFLVCQEFCLN